MLRGPWRDRLPPCALGLAGLLLLSTTLSLYAVRRDSVPMVADAAGYYRTTLVLDRLVERGRYVEAARKLVQTGVRPPLPQLLTVVLYRLTGQRSQLMARLSILPFLWLLLLGTYAVGRHLKDRPTGLVAAALLASFPQVVGFSRSYWMDLPLAAMTVVCLWAMLASDGLRRRGPSLALGLCCGLGLLTKYTFPLFIGPPLLYLALRGARRARRGPLPRRELRRRVENACLALLVTTALAAFWYMPTVGAAWRNFIFNQGAGVLRPRPWWALDNLTLYARHLPTQLGLPLVLALALTLPLFFTLTCPATRRLLLLWIAVPYLFFTYLVLGIEWARFTLPYLPALALTLALGLMQLRLHRALRVSAYALALLALPGQVWLTFRPPPPLPRGAFPWRRVQGRGLLTPRRFDFQAEMARLFPPSGRRWTHVALAPDTGSLASLLETMALEQGMRLRVSVPYEPEAHGFRGRFPFPRRVDDADYLRAFDYAVWVDHPAGTTVVVRRRDLYRRFLRAWRTVRPELQLTRRVPVPGGYTLLIHRRPATLSLP